MSIETVARVLDEIPGPVQPTVARLVRHITHDLKSPATAIAMEVFSSQGLLDELRARLGDGRDVLASIDEAAAMFDNIERASQALVDYLAAVDATVAAAVSGAANVQQ